MSEETSNTAGQWSLKYIVEAALLAAGEPVSVDRLQKLFDEEEQPSKASLREALDELSEEYRERGLELAEVATGFRLQVKRDLAVWMRRLWEEKPPRYSRALLETLALIAYRQPITRAEIEDVRGVSVSTNIVKTLQERGWIRVVGHRDAPGRPAMYGTTREFLDYFNLKSLDELPSLMELQDFDKITPELGLDSAGSDEQGTEAIEDTDKGDDDKKRDDMEDVAVASEQTEDESEGSADVQETESSLIDSDEASEQSAGSESEEVSGMPETGSRSS